VWLGVLDLPAVALLDLPAVALVAEGLANPDQLRRTPSVDDLLGSPALGPVEVGIQYLPGHIAGNAHEPRVDVHKHTSDVAGSCLSRLHQLSLHYGSKGVNELVAAGLVRAHSPNPDPADGRILTLDRIITAHHGAIGRYLPVILRHKP
jgi:hypothetical protein